jgi:hypothetical protein
MASTGEIIATVKSDPFIEAATRVADITSNIGVEAGFAAYRTADGSEISRIIDGRSTSHLIESAFDAMMMKYESVDIGSITVDFDASESDKHTYRNDLLVVVHSHPVDGLTASAAYKYLRPSLEDLYRHEEQEIDCHGLVNGILVARGGNKSIFSLFLYRRVGPDKPNYYQRFGDTQPSRRDLIESMVESGFAIAELRYDRNEGIYTPDPEVELEALSLSNS